jgi:hypothetical protein
MFFSIILLCGGYVAAAEKAPRQMKLDSCIGYYQDGEYQKAVDSLKALIPLITDSRQEAEAYKYIGFSFVMLDMINKAKEFFKVALDKFPQMVIDTLEVPPNITIVFKQTKMEKQVEKGDLLDKENQARGQRRTMAGTIFGSVGIVSCGVGVYYLFKGSQDYKTYSDWGRSGTQTLPPNYLDTLDYYKQKSNRELLIGGIGCGFGCINLAAAAYLLFKKDPQDKPRLGIFIGPNCGTIVYDF